MIQYHDLKSVFFFYSLQICFLKVQCSLTCLANIMNMIFILGNSADFYKLILDWLFILLWIAFHFNDKEENTKEKELQYLTKKYPWTTT